MTIHYEFTGYPKCGFRFRKGECDTLPPGHDGPHVCSNGYQCSTPGPTTYELRHQERPWTMNDARGKSNRWREAARTKEWRAAFASLAARLPHLDRVAITVHHETRTARRVDAGAIAPAAKAAIDGLRDAGVLTDDDGRYVTSLTFLPNVKTGQDAMTLSIEEQAT